MSANTNLQTVNDFLAGKTLALVGVSRKQQKFGNLAYRELTSRGYRVLPVNRNLEKFEGVPCYSRLQALPEKVDGVLIVVPPKETETIVKDVEAAGIKQVWMQQGSESQAAISFCKEHNILEVHGECILMFAPPVKSYHRFHRGIMRLLGKLPH